MSTATMSWALRQELATAVQQGLLYVIADSCDVAGTTRHCTPEYMEIHGRMPRATMFRRLGELEAYGLLTRQKFFTERGEAIYEIRLNLAALVNVPIKRRRPRDDGDEDSPEDTSPSGGDDGGAQAQEVNEIPESQSETLVSGEQSLTTAQAKSHSGDYHIDDPSLPKKESPPYPPPGGAFPKMELEAKAKRDALWERFKTGYPSIARMDQGLAREELDALPLDDAEWACSVLPALRKELEGPKAPPPRNAHLWLKKAMFKNFPRGKLDGPSLEPSRASYRIDSREGRAVIALCRVARKSLLESGGTVSFVGELTPAILAFAEADPRALWIENDRQIAAWLEFAAKHVRGERAEMRQTRGLGAELRQGIWAPWGWPPSKDGRPYEEPEPEEVEEFDDADQR